MLKFLLLLTFCIFVISNGDDTYDHDFYDTFGVGLDNRPPYQKQKMLYDNSKLLSERQAKIMKELAAINNQQTKQDGQLALDEQFDGLRLADYNRKFQQRMMAEPSQIFSDKVAQEDTPQEKQSEEQRRLEEDDRILAQELQAQEAIESDPLEKNPLEDDDFYRGTHNVNPMEEVDQVSQPQPAVDQDIQTGINKANPRTKKKKKQVRVLKDPQETSQKQAEEEQLLNEARRESQMKKVLDSPADVVKYTHQVAKAYEKASDKLLEAFKHKIRLGVIKGQAQQARGKRLYEEYVALVYYADKLFTGVDTEAQSFHQAIDKSMAAVARTDIDFCNFMKSMLPYEKKLFEIPYNKMKSSNEDFVKLLRSLAMSVSTGLLQLEETMMPMLTDVGQLSLDLKADKQQYEVNIELAYKAVRLESIMVDVTTVLNNIVVTSEMFQVKQVMIDFWIASRSERLSQVIPLYHKIAVFQLMSNSLQTQQKKVKTVTDVSILGAELLQIMIEQLPKFYNDVLLLDSRLKEVDINSPWWKLWAQMQQFVEYVLEAYVMVKNQMNENFGYLIREGVKLTDYAQFKTIKQSYAQLDQLQVQYELIKPGQTSKQ